MNNWKLASRDLIYQLASKLTTNFSNRFTVLCYHAFDNSNWRFSVSLKQLENQLKIIKSQGEFISVKDLSAKWNKSVKNQFLITIDDGYTNVLSAVKVFEKYGVKPLLFVIADSKNVDRKELANNKELLTITEVKSLIKKGWTIGCHSLTHADFANLPEDKLVAEIINSKNVLEKKLGIKIEYFAYPKGAYTQSIVDAVKKAGYKMAFTMDDSQIITTTDKLRIPRVGVDQTHKNHFENIYSTGSIMFRQAVKASPLKGAIL